MDMKMGLQPFGAGIWLERAPVRIVGTELTSTMSVLKLGDGGVLVYSPVELTPARRAAVEAIGEVRHLYAPNTFHHQWLGGWATAYPTARVHAPRALRSKRPELRIDRYHDSEPEPAFAGVVDEVHVDGCRLHETVLLVRPSATLLVADLVQNIGQPEGTWTKIYTKSMGFYDQVALSRFLRWTAFDDRKLARRSIDEILALNFERLVVGHGTPVFEGGREALRTAYTWLSKE